MSKFIEIAEDVKVFGNKFRALVELADFLEDIGNLGQASKEALAEKTRCLGLRDEAKRELTLAESKLSDAKQKIVGYQDEGQLIVSEANAISNKLIKDSTARGVEIIEAAKKKASGIDSKVLASNKTLASIDADIQERTGELEALTVQIKNIKGKLQAFMGDK